MFMLQGKLDSLKRLGDFQNLLVRGTGRFRAINKFLILNEVK